LAEIHGLIDDARAGGLDLELQVQGQPVTLFPCLDLSAYRILQAGLTNALRHADATQDLLACRCKGGRSTVRSRPWSPA